MRIEFTKDKDVVQPERTTSYKAGDKATVAKELGDVLIGEGVATEITEDAAELEPERKRRSGR